MIPRRELAPGADVHFGGIRDAWNVVFCPVFVREAVARCRETIKSFEQYPRLERKYKN